MLNRLFKLHLTLIQYLNREFRKKRTFKQLILFIKIIAIQYFSVMVKEYSNMFNYLDKDYRKQLKQMDKYKQIRTDLSRALKLLQLVEKRMKEKGLPRWKIRQFFRDFYRDGQVREDVINDLMKEVKI